MALFKGGPTSFLPPGEYKYITRQSLFRTFILYYGYLSSISIDFKRRYIRDVLNPFLALKIANCTNQDHKATLLEDPYEDSTAIVDVEVGC
jgi:hypothetical protein